MTMTSENVVTPHLQDAGQGSRDLAHVKESLAEMNARARDVAETAVEFTHEQVVNCALTDKPQENADRIAKANAAATMETLKALGVKEFLPVTAPEFSPDASAIEVEMAAYFDAHRRSGRMAKARGGGRPTAFLTNAVDFLNAQRQRMMMMEQLAKATAHVDVYVVASNSIGRGGPGGRPPGAGGGPRPGPRPPQRPGARHFAQANLAGYPAVNVPNGFAEATPTSIVFYAQPFREAALLAFAKAYQDRAQFHTKRPSLT